MDIPTTDKQIKFCEAWLEGNNNADAARIAGYEGTSNESFYTIGCRLKKQYGEYLTQQTIDHMKGGGARAYKILCDLMESSDNRSVQLKAAIAVLQFGGYEPASRKDVTITHRTEAEIDAQLNALLGSSKAIEKAKSYVGKIKVDVLQ